MYTTQTLRNNLQEWGSRLYKSNHLNFENNYTFFINKLEENNILKSFLYTATSRYTIPNEKLEEIYEQLHEDGIFPEFKFENEVHASSIFYQLLIFLKSKGTPTYFLTQTLGFGENRQAGFLENYVQPILDYLQDSLDDVNIVLYLIERYKLRTEWFMVESLSTKYQQATKGYEKILESDLRLFLFDQGVKYPLSTPRSPSGDIDIAAMIESDTPLVCEVKILDSNMNYGKERIIIGFSQIYKYTTDYHLNIGYLVIFNFDAAVVHFNFSNDSNQSQHSVTVNGVTLFITVINLNQEISASNTKGLKVITVNEAELIKAIE